MDHPSGSERGTETQQGTLHLHCAPDYPLDGSPASLGCRQGQWEESRFSDKEPRAQAQFTELPKITWLVSEEAPEPPCARWLARVTVRDLWVLIAVTGF